MLKKLKTIIIFITFNINIYLAGLNRGYDLHFIQQGLHSSGFELLTHCYIYICLFMLIFIFGNYIDKKPLSNILCYSSLFLLFYPYKWIYLQKNLFYDDSASLDLIFKESFPIDIISLLLIVSLLVIQITTSFQNYIEWKRNNAKVE